MVLLVNDSAQELCKIKDNMAKNKERKIAVKDLWKIFNMWMYGYILID